MCECLLGFLFLWCVNFACVNKMFRGVSSNTSEVRDKRGQRLIPRLIRRFCRFGTYLRTKISAKYPSEKHVASDREITRIE